MSSKQQPPLKQTPVRTRTPSLSASMRPPAATPTGSSPSRRASQSLSRPVAIPPKTAPRSSNRSSLILSATDRRKLASALEEVPETDNIFVSYITDSLLTRLTGCTNLKEAKFLKIAETDAKVKFIENMDRVENLEELDMGDNEIAQIRGLSVLKRLRILNLSTNMITMIEGLEHLLRLEELDLSGNQIERIPASMRALIALKVLKLHNNKLSTLRDLVHLRPLKNLISLTIFQNPIAELEHGRSFAVYQIPSVNTLDDALVDDEEREAAHSRFNREEIEILEQQLAKSRLEEKAAREEIGRLVHSSGASKPSERRLGKDLTSLEKRIEQLEAEGAAKTELLNKKSSELVGLCELLYEMKQELAFANIDRQFDMSAVDSIIGGANELEAEGSATTGTLSPNYQMGFGDDLDSQLDAIDAEEFASHSYGSHGGILSPAMFPSSDILSPLPFGFGFHGGGGNSIAQEFREMPYIGKTSATPTRHGAGSRPGSRAPNGMPPTINKRQMMEINAQTQQAAHRYKSLQLQESALQSEINQINQTLERELAALEDLRQTIAVKQKFVDENPDAPETFEILLEIETLKSKLSAQERVVAQISHKRSELEARIAPIRTEAEQMKSLLGDLDEEAIDKAYDLSMEVKSLEVQLEDRDEQLQKMRMILEKHGLLGEVDKTVILRDTNKQHAESVDEALNGHTHTESHTFTSEAVLAKLREMEQNHIQRVQALIAGFPKYLTESAYWGTKPSSVEEACHTLEQQITDAFGFSFGGSALTASVASLRDRIKQLESHVEYLEHLKITNFFNIEDDIEDIDPNNVELESTAASNALSLQTNESQEMFFTLPQQLEVKCPEIETASDNNGEGNEIDDIAKQKNNDVFYAVRREKLGQSLSRQLWFLWRLLAMKMESVRKAWESGAIPSHQMQEIVSSGEWKYWTGMGRLEFFFRHAMSHISLLEKQIEQMKAQLSSLPSPQTLVASESGGSFEHLLVKEKSELVTEIETLSTELALKKTDTELLRQELEDLGQRRLASIAQKEELDQLSTDLNILQEKKEIAQEELSGLKMQIDQCKATKKEVESLQEKYDKLCRSVSEASQAREELQHARREYATITVQISGMKRMTNELEALKKELAEVQQEHAAAQARQFTLKPPSHIRSATMSPSINYSNVTSQNNKSLTKAATSSANSTSSANTISTETPSTISLPVTAASTASSPSPSSPSSPSSKTSTITDATQASPAKVCATDETPADGLSLATSTSSGSSPNLSSSTSGTPPSRPPRPAITRSVTANFTGSTSVSSAKDRLVTSSSPEAQPQANTDHISATQATPNEDVPPLSPSSSSSSINSGTSGTDSIANRLSTYRQKELEARRLKELEVNSKMKRIPPKRSWTVAETTGLARAAGPLESPRPVTVSPSTFSDSSTITSPTATTPTITAAAIAAPSAPFKASDSAPEVATFEERKDRHKSHIPKGLQEFLKQTNGPQ